MHHKPQAADWAARGKTTAFLPLLAQRIPFFSVVLARQMAMSAVLKRQSGRCPALWRAFSMLAAWLQKTV
jgi:hypothetical protein